MSRLFHNLNILNWIIIAICVPYFGLICTSLYRSCVVYKRVRSVLIKIEGRSISGNGNHQSAAQMRQRGLDAKARVLSGEVSGDARGPPPRGSSNYDNLDDDGFSEFTNIWSRLSIWDKIKFFRWWVLCTLVAIITNTLASVLRLVHSYNNNQMGAADDQLTMWLDSIGIALLYIQVPFNKWRTCFALLFIHFA